MFNSPFSKSVSFSSVSEITLDQLSLLPEEEILLSEFSIEKRKREFTLGRGAARKALEGLGIYNTAVGKGNRREPLWPEGICGAISHTDGYAVAAVALKHDVIGLGIDIENVCENQKLNIVEKIALQDEKKWITEDIALSNLRTVLLFSAKETVFKALYPLCNTFLDYSSVSLKDASRDTLLFRLSEKTLGIFKSVKDVKIGKELQVRYSNYTLEDGRVFVMTSIEITNNYA